MAQTRFYCFTRFATHGSLETQDIEDILRPISTYYVFQQEVTPDTGRVHLQGYVVLLRKTRLTTLYRKFAAHFEIRRGTHQQALDYCTKDETRRPNTVPITYGTFEGGAGRRNDIAAFRDAVEGGRTNWQLLHEHPTEMAKFPRFLQLVRTETLQQRLLAELPEFVPRPGWQSSLVRTLAQAPHPRTVIWRWEPIGAVGKSFFALNFLPAETFLVTGGKHTDIQYAYQAQRYVFFDWSRHQETSFPYGLVEQFKNGYFLSTKYESIAKRFSVPHVVVFANFSPDFMQMSIDRWDSVLI